MKLLLLLVWLLLRTTTLMIEVFSAAVLGNNVIKSKDDKNHEWDTFENMFSGLLDNVFAINKL